MMRLVPFPPILSLTILILFLPFVSYSQRNLNDALEIRENRVEKAGDNVIISMEMEIKDTGMKSGERYVFTPILTNGDHESFFPKIELAGRRQRIYQERFRRKEHDAYYARLTHKKGHPQRLSYLVSVPFERWMDGATLSIREESFGCSNRLLNADLAVLKKVKLIPGSFLPHLAYIQPEAAPKHAELQGSAYLIFKVNRTEIEPHLGDNTRELSAIHAQAEEISSEEFATLHEIRLHGYASPEGRYAHNAYLAQQRVDAVRDYLSNQYNYALSLIKTNSTPENWEGLKKKIEASALPNRSEILAIIDKDIDPDRKELEIRNRYPQDYSYMLKEFYPGLRRTDYTISYAIRSFTVEEAKELLKTRPALLSLHEMYLIAREYKPGDEMFDEVFDIAVKMFPDDEVANLNAANTSLLKGDTRQAEKYLAKAGDSPQSANSRGVLAMLKEDFPQAAGLLKKAAAAGVTEARENLKQVMERLENEQSGN